MKVVFVNRFFLPDVAPTGVYAADVAFDLAKAGHEVHVVASRLAYGGKRPVYAPRESLAGVRVHRVWTTAFGRNALIGRACDYATFYITAGWSLWRLVRRGDIVVAKTDPPLICVIATLASRLRGAHVVNWLQDVFPEVGERFGMKLLSGPLGNVARALRNWSLEHAALNVVLGERMAAEVARLVPGARLRVVPNWADASAVATTTPEASALRRERGLDGKFVVGYSGNLGRAHDCETLIAAARLLSADSDIAFSIVGGGFHLERLRHAGLPNVALHDYVPNAQLGRSLASCDVHLVSLLPPFEGLVVPSKFYAVMAIGLPVLFVGDAQGEIARAISAHGCGVTVAMGDAEAFAAAVRRLRDYPAERLAMGERGRIAFAREWAKPIALARWRQVIGEVQVVSRNR